jgi:hypothetical protein
MRNVSNKTSKENQNTRFIFSKFFPEKCALYEIMLKNMVEPERGHKWQYGGVVCAGLVRLHTQNHKAVRVHPHPHACTRTEICNIAFPWQQ